MNKKLNLKPGNYWFYGLPYENIKPEDHQLFTEFLNTLPVIDTYITSFRWDTGNPNYDSPDRIFGLFYFHYDPSVLSDVNWCSKQGEKEKYNQITRDDFNWIRLDFKRDLNPLVESLVLEFPKGTTICDETCSFYWFCDRRRKSSMNPVSFLGLSCEDYNFKLNNIKTDLNEEYI